MKDQSTRSPKGTKLETGEDVGRRSLSCKHLAREWGEEPEGQGKRSPHRGGGKQGQSARKDPGATLSPRRAPRAKEKQVGKQPREEGQSEQTRKPRVRRTRARERKASPGESRARAKRNGRGTEDNEGQGSKAGKTAPQKLIDPAQVSTAGSRHTGDGKKGKRPDETKAKRREQSKRKAKKGKKSQVGGEKMTEDGKLRRLQWRGRGREGTCLRKTSKHREQKTAKLSNPQGMSGGDGEATGMTATAGRTTVQKAGRPTNTPDTGRTAAKMSPANGRPAHQGANGSTRQTKDREPNKARRAKAPEPAANGDRRSQPQ